MSPTEALPQEMMQHTYPILYEVEESHWWYIGRRRINVPALNGVLGGVLGAENTLLRYMNLPFGVFGVCIARRID